MLPLIAHCLLIIAFNLCIASDEKDNLFLDEAVKKADFLTDATKYESVFDHLIRSGRVPIEHLTIDHTYIRQTQQMNGHLMSLSCHLMSIIHQHPI